MAKATRSARTAASPSRPKFKDTGHARNYCQIAAEYARSAVDDRKNKKHCKWVRLAAKRFLGDLARTKKSGCQFTFSAHHGNDVCDFIEKLPHVEGQWDTKTIRLEAPQIFILVNVFGFRRRDGYRRFSDVYIEMARKGAKSTLTAGIALYCLTCEGETGPEIVIGATTGDQARKVFNPAKKMVERLADLREAFNVRPWARSITCEDNGGCIQPINAKSSTQDGWNPHVGILDELHAHKDRGLHDVIKSAFGSRKNPLMWRITTAGYNSLGVCFEQRTLVTHILDGLFEADHYFGIIFTLDEGDDEFDESCWIKANPMLGITPTMENMRNSAKEALRSPASRGEFFTKRLNKWTTAKNGWVNIEFWKKCLGDLKVEDMAGITAYGGLDLASTTDIAAFALVWLKEGWVNIKVRCYLPREAVQPRTERGNVPYQVWADAGWLILTDGNVTDYEFIEKDIGAALKEFQIKELAFDPWNATDLTNRLQSQGAPMVEFRQGPKSYHPAMQAFEKAMLAKRIRHDGNPVLSWAVSNLVARKDANENMAPDKKHALEKIDPIVAALMAIGRAIANEGQSKKSAYEDRGVIFL